MTARVSLGSTWPSRFSNRESIPAFWLVAMGVLLGFGQIDSFSHPEVLLHGIEYVLGKSRA